MEENVEKVEAMKPMKLMSASNSIEADMIVDILESNGIPCMKEQRGSGSYMNIAYGFSVYGTEIFVDEADYDHALELIKDVSDEPIEKEVEDDNVNDYPFYRNPRIIARIWLAAIISGGLFIYILNKFN